MSEQMPKVVEIYTESTPNPKMLKFVTTISLLPNMILDCQTVEDAKESPLAQHLYLLDFVDTIFVSNNFITIGKKDGLEEEWFELTFEVKEVLKAYLKEDNQIVTQKFLDDQAAQKAANSERSDVDTQIMELLDKYVKPAVELDGGFIGFKSFEKGVVTLSLQGACSGCPSSSVTLKDGIEAMLKRMVPGVEEVVADAE